MKWHLMPEWVVWNSGVNTVLNLKVVCINCIIICIQFLLINTGHIGATIIPIYIYCNVHTASMRMTYSCPTLAWHNGQEEKNPGHRPIQSTAYDFQLTGKWKCDKEQCLIPVTVPLETSSSLDLQTHPRFIKCQLMPWVSPIIFIYTV